MKVCIVHIDDENDEPRRVSERIAVDGLDYYFKRPVQNGRFSAGKNGLANAKLTWSYDDVDYELDYIKCLDQDELTLVDVTPYKKVVFVFDVHRDTEYGTGKLLLESEVIAEKLIGDEAFTGVIWTNFPDSDAVKKSRVTLVRQKKNVEEFAIELMKLLGFEIRE